MLITHPGCDARWTGVALEHCPACHLTFASTDAGDMHRTGTHGVTEGRNRRRCLTVDEMRGLRNKAGEPWFESTEHSSGIVVWRRRRSAHMPVKRWQEVKTGGNDGNPSISTRPEVQALQAA